MQAGIIILRFDPIDIGDFQESDLPDALDDHTVKASGLLTLVVDLLLGAEQGPLEAYVVEWLQEIVESSGIKGAHRVLVVCSDEDNRFGPGASQQFEHVESVTLGHLNIKEEEVGIAGPNLNQSFGSGTALGDGSNIRIESQ